VGGEDPVGDGEAVFEEFLLFLLGGEGGRFEDGFLVWVGVNQGNGG